MKGEVTITHKGVRWYETGHPWIYKDDLKTADGPSSGAVVRVKAPDGQLLGQAFYNAASKIALRMLTQDPQEQIDRDFWAGRFEAAVAYRKRIVTDSNACRLVFSEADGFPGLIVDRYADILVFQVLSLGIEQLLPLLVELAVEFTGAKAVLGWNDSPVRKLEGLSAERKLLFGEEPKRVEVTEGKRRYIVDFSRAQKTGAYLDQRENRIHSGSFAKGRVLDVFAYQGGFSLQAAGTAQEVVAIEDSEQALNLLQENAALNGFKNIRAEKANAFDRLREMEKQGEQFDLVILDPPAFAKSKAELQGAKRGYREINLRAMRLLKPEGILITCSCSYNMTEELFLETLRQASVGAGRAVRLLENRTQSKDHPILLTHPESKYLKCLILETI